MYCNRILTNVEHWVGSKTRKDSFFAVEITWDEMGDALELLGAAHVDVHSMTRFMEWCRGEIMRLTLLISLDSKFVVVGDTDNLQHIVNFDVAEAWPLNLEGNGIYGTVEGKFQPYLDGWIARQPEMASVLGYKPKKVTLKNRISFSRWVVLEFNPAFFGEVRELDGATDANLALAYVNPQLTITLNQVKFEDVLDAIRERAENGWRSDEDWFDSQGLTLAELDRRRERANDNLNKLEQLFWAATNRALEDSGSLPHRFWASDFELVSFLSKFKKLDEVIELYVLAASHPEFDEGLREIAWELVCRLDDSAPAGPMDTEDF